MVIINMIGIQRKSAFTSLILKITYEYFCLSASAGIFVLSKEHPEETIDETLINARKSDFYELKRDLCNSLAELKGYDEITLDSGIENKIRKWEFETFETESELTSWRDELSDYFTQLNLGY